MLPLLAGHAATDKALTKVESRKRARVLTAKSTLVKANAREEHEATRLAAEEAASEAAATLTRGSTASPCAKTIWCWERMGFLVATSASRWKGSLQGSLSDPLYISSSAPAVATSLRRPHPQSKLSWSLSVARRNSAGRGQTKRLWSATRSSWVPFGLSDRTPEIGKGA